MKFLNQDEIDLNVVDSMDYRVVLVIPPENNQLLILFRNDVKEKLKDEGLSLRDLFNIYSVTDKNSLSPVCINTIEYIKDTGFVETYSHNIICKNCWFLKNYCGFIIHNYEIDDLKRIIYGILKQYEKFKSDNDNDNDKSVFNMITI